MIAFQEFRKRRQIISTVLMAIILLAVLFGSAGTLYWRDAWILILFYFFYAICLTLWIYKRNPELLIERWQRRREGKKWDRVLLKVYVILFVAFLMVLGLDAVRFKWTSLPDMARYIGYIAYAIAAVIVFLTFRENPYLSSVVRIQEDRYHTVIQSGPYRLVRHPLYFSVILSYFATSLILGSLLALAASMFLTALLVIRTWMEDRTLKKELNGYMEYAKKVRYKLVPGIW